MKNAIVILTRTDGELECFGPFANGEEATRWGFDNCKGFEWHWQEISPVNEPIVDQSTRDFQAFWKANRDRFSSFGAAQAAWMENDQPKWDATEPGDAYDHENKHGY
jgi:hypothetical protein